MSAEPGRHEARRPELLPGVTVRSAVLVLGVLLLQLGFVLSYIGAFHAPTPRDVPVAVVAPSLAPAGTAQRVAEQLNGIEGTPLDARAAGTEADARQLLADRDVDGVLVIGTAAQDTLLLAGAEGGALSSALTQVVGAVSEAQQRTLVTEDAIPAASGDARGLSAFYLAVGWVVGGYLVAAIIGVSSGSVPRTRLRAGVRLGTLAVYAVVSGIGGAVIAGPVLGAFDTGSVPLAAFGALVVFAVGAATMALQVWTGLVGIGLAILIFVVLGNPSAGGAYPSPLLPPFWAWIGPWLPPGAATDAVRGIVYFDGAGVRSASLVLAAYGLAGLAATLAGAGRGVHEDAATVTVPTPGPEPERVRISGRTAS